jgi:hypothetical protein
MAQLVRNHTGATRTKLRSLNATAYNWLERHDSAWLEAVLPPRQPPGGTRVPRWREKDEVLFPRIAAAVAEIYNLEGRPRRVSVRAISVQLGRGGNLGASLAKMPKTQMEVEKYLESYEAYTLRRIRWAAAQFVAEMILPSTPYVLAKRAGISTIAEAERLCDLQTEHDSACAAVRAALGAIHLDEAMGVPDTSVCRQAW